MSAVLNDAVMPVDLPALPVVPPVSVAIAGSNARFSVRRVFCIGRNYWWQAGEKEAVLGPNRDEREAPFFFMKPADALVPASGDIAYPPGTASFCHEVELVVAIGQDGVDIAADAALSHVWGYALGLDLTRRDLQLAAKAAGRPWESAKAFDASAPITPVVPIAPVVSSALSMPYEHPESGAIWLAVNGEIRQNADLSDQIWQPRDLICFLSRSVTLRAGDLIFTGTPVGVSALHRGDVVTAGIDDLSELSVTIV
jgi:fumarylpyruvate hydrolase